MAQEKKMDEVSFSAIVKEVTSLGELIRTHQGEKQSVMDNFDSERERYQMGKISKKALDSSSKKVNKELGNLDRAIRKDISMLSSVAHKARQFAAKQSPHAFRASVTGISRSSQSKKKHHKR